MTTKEQIRQVLDKWKFPVIQESDRSLVFRYQMSYIQADIMDGEEAYAIAVTLSGIFSAETDEEMLLGLRACNDINCSMLQAKLYIDSDSDLVIAAEFFHRAPEDMEYLLSVALNSLIVAKKNFTQKYNELREEAALASELEQE